MSEIAACTLIQEEPARKTERYMMMFKDYPDVVSVQHLQEMLGGRAEDCLPAGQGKQNPVCPCGAQLQDSKALRCGVPAGQDLTFRRDAAPKIPCAILAKHSRIF